MALSLHFPRLETEFPSEIALLRVKHRPWTREAAGELAHRLEVRADADDAGLWLIARDERSVLEVYQASQSFRYSRTDLDGEGRDGIREQLDPERARRMAEEWIAPFLPQEGRAEVSSITEQEVLVSERQGDEPRA